MNSNSETTEEQKTTDQSEGAKEKSGPTINYDAVDPTQSLADQIGSIG